MYIERVGMHLLYSAVLDFRLYRSIFLHPDWTWCFWVIMSSMCYTCFLLKVNLISEFYKLKRVWAPLPITSHFPSYSHGILITWPFLSPSCHVPSSCMENYSLMVIWFPAIQFLSPHESLPVLTVLLLVMINFHITVSFTSQYKFYIYVLFDCLSTPLFWELHDSKDEVECGSFFISPVLRNLPGSIELVPVEWMWEWVSEWMNEWMSNIKVELTHTCQLHV